MNNRIILCVALSVFFALVADSCSKQKSPTTATERLVGRWKLTKLASDDNNDGVIEGYEIHPIAAQEDIELYFDNDAAGVEYDTYNGVTQPNLNFIWTVINGDTLRINYRANDTVTYSIQNINSSDMTLTEHSDSLGLLWFYYVKR